MEVIRLPQKNRLWRTFHLVLPCLVCGEIAVPSIGCDNAARNLRSRMVDSAPQIKRWYGQQNIVWVIVAWVSEGNSVTVYGRVLPESLCEGLE